MYRSGQRLAGASEGRIPKGGELYTVIFLKTKPCCWPLNPAAWGLRSLGGKDGVMVAGTIADFSRKTEFSPTFPPTMTEKYNNDRNGYVYCTGRWSRGRRSPSARTNTMATARSCQAGQLWFRRSVVHTRERLSCHPHIIHGCGGWGRLRLSKELPR
jgi:hypothetical protein